MSLIPAFEGHHLLVVGDVMLDRYWYGDTARISPEAPVPVVHISRREDRPGGAANVAVNISTLGTKVTVMGLVGEDDAAVTLRHCLQERALDCELIAVPEAPTITKLRIVSRNQQLIRLDFERSEPGVRRSTMHSQLEHRVTEHLQGVDALILSDYAKGALADPQPLIAAALRTGKPVLVDPKGLDWARYRGATVLTPNAGELEAVVGRCADATILAERGEALRRELNVQALLVTRSEQGMMLLEAGAAPLELPAQAREVFDVTGAGDTVIALLAAGLAAGQPLATAARLANLAAGLVVGKLGTASVTAAELHRAVSARDIPPGGVVDASRLKDYVARARAAGETVVMTNGCFDLLHAGHVRFLQAARALGDRLIVAVNDDDSVRRLKGAGRPVNPLGCRAEVIAALGCVDWVTAFSEDTPARLIGEILPDILVKGGDYRPEQVAGGDCVRASGGAVCILPYHDDLSTTAMIDRLRTDS